MSKTSDKNNSIPAPRLSPDELARLVVAAQDNKDIHFADLYKAAWPQVYYLAFGMLGTEIDASDVAQQAFINIFEHLDALKDPQAAAAWVNKTTLNAARNFLKNRKRHQSRTVSLDALTDTPDAHDQPAAPTQHTPHPQQPHAEFTPGHTLEQQERNALIFDLTQDLPDASREVIILHYQEEHSIAAIARILDLTENAVTLRLHRARKQLRAALEAFEASGSLSRFALATFGVGGALQAHAQTALIPAPSQAPWQALLEGIGGSASQPDTPRASRAKNAQLTRSYVTTPHVLMIAVAGVAAVAGITFALTHNTLLGGGHSPERSAQLAANSVPPASTESTPTVILSEARSAQSKDLNSSSTTTPTASASPSSKKGIPGQARNDEKGKTKAKSKTTVTVDIPADKPTDETPTPRVSDQVQFATYHDTPLIWRITALSKTTLTLITDQVLVAGTYRADPTAPDASDYAASDARQWLVNTFTPALYRHSGLDPESLFLPANTLGDTATLPTADDLAALPTRTAAPHPWATANPGYSGAPLYTASNKSNYWLATAHIIDLYGTETAQPPYYLSAGIRPLIKLDPTTLELRPEKSGLFIATPP